MNWNNLKENKCPQCDKAFGSMSFESPGLIICFNPERKCSFRIRESRLSEIVNSQINQDLQDKWDKDYEGNSNLA